MTVRLWHVDFGVGTVVLKPRPEFSCVENVRAEISSEIMLAVLPVLHTLLSIDSAELLDQRGTGFKSVGNHQNNRSRNKFINLRTGRPWGGPLSPKVAQKGL